MRDLARSGCTSIVLLRDCDREEEAALRGTLERIQKPRAVERLVCIAVEELEAWFWSDPKVVHEVGRGKGKALEEPHRLKDPKEALVRLSRDEGKKPLYSVNDNPSLAERLDLALCEERCPAFRELKEFVLAHVDPQTSPKNAKRMTKRHGTGGSRSRSRG